MAISSNDLARIRSLELRTRRLMQSSLAGNYRTTKRGYGLDFDQLRDYEQGDDMRFIDWNSSARSGRLMVKQFLHDHTPTVIIALDLSASTLFGSSNRTVSELLQDSALILLYASLYWQASVGLILFDEDIIEAAWPRKNVILPNLLEKVITSKPTLKKTSWVNVLKTINQHQKRNSLIFLLSDCIDSAYQTELMHTARKHELVVVRALDPLINQLPHLGYIHIQDSETGQKVLINSQQVNIHLQERIAKQTSLFQRCGIGHIDIQPEQDLIGSIGHFFLKNIKKQ